MMWHAIIPTFSFGRALRWTPLLSVVSKWHISLLCLKAKNVSWLSIFIATTSLPAISWPNSIIHLQATPPTMQAKEHAQKSYSITHGYATGRQTSIIISLTLIAKIQLEWWAKSHAGLVSRCRSGSRESTSAGIRSRGPGTAYTGDWDFRACTGDGVSKTFGRVGGMEQAMASWKAWND